MNMLTDIVKVSVIAAMFVLTACSRPSGCCCCSQSADSSVTVAVSVPVTVPVGGVNWSPSASASVASSAVQLQVLVFHKREAVSYVSATMESTEVVFETEGSPLDLFAMVGGPDLSGVGTEDECLSTEFSLDSCHMCVPQAGLQEDCRPTAVWRGEVTVTPLLCRVRVCSVSRRMADSVLRDVPMAVTRVFLANAASVARLDGASPVDLGWRNSVLADGGRISVADTFLCRTLPVPLPLADGETVELGMDFFCCPNSCSSDRDGVRATRPMVAIAADIDGDGLFSLEEENFYPLPLGALSAGGYYEVSGLQVAHLGNPSDGDDVIDPGEDDPVTRSSASFTVTVAPWNVVLLGEGGTLEI